MMPGTELYTVAYFEVVVKKDMLSLSKATKLRIKKAIEERLQTDPIGFGKPLRYSLQGYRCLRVGDYRIVSFLEAKQRSVQVVAIKHRKDICTQK